MTPSPAGFHTSDGQFHPIDSLPADSDQVVKRVLSLDVCFEPFSEFEADVDPDVFREELGEYVREVLQFPKGEARLAISYAGGGRLAGWTFWVFRSDTVETMPLYLFVIRNGAMTEIACNDTSAGYFDPVANVQYDKVLEPAQAALLELLAAEGLGLDTEG